MAIVETSQLIARMGGPQWTPETRRDAEALLVRLESALERALNTRISPGVERTERAPVSEAGMIVTNHPVAEVLSIDGKPVSAVGDKTHLPAGWALIDHRVRRTTMGNTPGEVAFPSPAIYDTTGLYGGAGVGLAGMLPGIDRAPVLVYATITYRPGWGAVGALQEAILRKAKAIMTNHHSTTITARGLEGSKPAKVDEEWTDDDLKALATFRDIPGPMSTRW